MLITTKDPRLISYQTLRKAIGWMGISLPAAMIVVNLFFGDCNMVQSSVSHYYYTVSGSLFIGILCAVALFLITYKGYNRIDRICNSVAGILAVVIALFPTNISTLNAANSTKYGCFIFELPENPLRNSIHYISAGLFFIMLACISLFLFTKSEGKKTAEKKLRNKVYKSCGVIIFVAIAAIAVYGIFDKDGGLSSYKPVFWLEWIALIAFGTSWLVKGEMVLEDKG